MKRSKQIWLLALFTLLASMRASAQMDRVVAEAKGITWGSCAAVMEIALRRLDGVDKVVISIKKQMFAVTYKAGASFQPKNLRDAVAQADVAVIRFHISARGKVQQDGDKQFFLVGKDRFLVVDSPKLPTTDPIGVMGVVNDSTNPLQLKIDDFKPLNPWPPIPRAIPIPKVDRHDHNATLSVSP